MSQRIEVIEQDILTVDGGDWDRYRKIIEKYIYNVKYYKLHGK